LELLDIPLHQRDCDPTISNLWREQKQQNYDDSKAQQQVTPSTQDTLAREGDLDFKPMTELKGIPREHGKYGSQDCGSSRE
jgi:hypothetical protein